MALIFKLLFKLMGRVCCKKTWVSVLDVNFSNFLNSLREVLKNDLEIFFYLKFRFYSFIINNLSLYSVFAHQNMQQKKPNKHYCNFCSRIYTQILNNEYIFSDIIVDEQDITSQINKFFSRRSLLSLDVCHAHSLWINTKMTNTFGCTYTEDTRTPNKLFRVFLSILIRLYISYFLSLLNEVKFNEEHANFFT